MKGNLQICKRGGMWEVPDGSVNLAGISLGLFRFMFGSFRAKLTPHDFTSNTGSIVGQLSGGDAGHVFGVTKIRGGSMYATYTIQRMTVRIPYSQFVGSPGTSVLVWRRLSLPAAALAQMRSLCRFRCGQLVLRHLDNKVSSAHCQACIFCGATVRNAMVHCLSSCPHWSNFRNALRSALSRPSEDNCQKFALLALRAESRDAVAVMCGWAARMDQECSVFWHRT